MPGRETKFVNGGFYHIFNKTIDGKRVFNNDYYAQLFLELIKFYRPHKMPISHSEYLKANEDIRARLNERIKSFSQFQIEILAYCLMPNHFHFLVKQRFEKGVIKFVSDLTNSFTRYFNINNERLGSLFLSPFKAVEIRRREQLIHVFRYILLNPYSAGMVSSTGDLLNYPYSSLREYVLKKIVISDKEIIVNEFGNNTKNLEKFILDNASYQRQLELIKEHVKLE
jgi:putative transposase